MAEVLSQAFEELQANLLGYLQKRLPELMQAEDLLQDVFLKALAAEQSGRSIENPSAWLRTATRNALVDYFRKKPVEFESIEEELVDETQDDFYMHQRLSTCLLPFVKELQPIYRDTLIAIDFDRKPMSEVAKEFDVSLSAVKSRASRGRVLLKQKVLQCCHVETEGGFVSDYYPVEKK